MKGVVVFDPDGRYWCNPSDHRLQLCKELSKETPDESVITVLLQQHPKIFRIKYKFPYRKIKRGADKVRNFVSYPLSRIVALFPSLSIELVKAVYETYPDAIYEADEDGRLPIHYACRFGQYPTLELLIYLIDKYPNSIQTANNDGLLPLHYACSNQRSIEIIQYLVSLYWDAVMTKTTEAGWYPLHFACHYPHTPDIVKYILDLYPEACKEQSTNRSKALPIHNLCFAAAKNENITLEVLQQLVQAYPQAVQQQNRGGNYPLHALLLGVPNNDNDAIIVHRQDDPGVDHSDTTGDHHRLQLPDIYPLVNYLIKCYPHAIQCTNKSKKTPLPLQIVCRWSSTYYKLNVVVRLLEEHPEAVRRKSPSGKTALQLMHDTANEEREAAAATMKPIDMLNDDDDNAVNNTVTSHVLECVDNNYDMFIALSHSERGNQLNTWKEEGIQKSKAERKKHHQSPPGDEDAAEQGQTNAPRSLLGAHCKEGSNETPLSVGSSERMRYKQLRNNVTSSPTGELEEQSRPGAIPIPGINSSAISEDNDTNANATETEQQHEEIMDGDHEGPPMTAPFTTPLVTVTPIASEISPSVQQMEEELQELRQKLRATTEEEEVVVADAEEAIVEAMQVAVESPVESKCCIMM